MKIKVITQFLNIILHLECLEVAYVINKNIKMNNILQSFAYTYI